MIFEISFILAAQASLLYFFFVEDADDADI
jgi:hypothetical protein